LYHLVRIALRFWIQEEINDMNFTSSVIE